MASLTRRMQLRTKRLNQRKLRNNVSGTKLGIRNARAPKPLSLTPRGSHRRAKVNSGFRNPVAAVQYKKPLAYIAATKADRQAEHAIRMTKRRARQLPRSIAA